MLEPENVRSHPYRCGWESLRQNFGKDRHYTVWANFSVSLHDGKAMSTTTIALPRIQGQPEQGLRNQTAIEYIDDKAKHITYSLA